MPGGRPEIQKGFEAGGSGSELGVARLTKLTGRVDGRSVLTIGCCN